MAPTLYYRKFNRDSAFDDEDFVAGSQFLAENFIDFFGKWLQEDDNAEIQSHDEIVLKFWDNSIHNVQTFMVADSGVFARDTLPPWFNSSARFITFISLSGKQFFDPSTQNWTFCVVGGNDPKETNREHSFLQVISWNGIEFRFYQSDFANGDSSIQAWNYFGRSRDAFGPNSYLGPFNGHVNGACIMKEIHQPWLHWLAAPGQFNASFSDATLKTWNSVVWLSGAGQGPLSLVNTNPGQLESHIVRGINNWFNKRRELDFLDSSKQPLTNPINVSRWVAHLFLTTTINLGAALSTGEAPGVSPSDADYILPPDHLYDSQLLGSASLTQLLTNLDESIKTKQTVPIPLPQIGFKDPDYTEAVKALNLSIVQRVGDQDLADTFELPWTFLGGDKRGEEEKPIYVKVVAKDLEGTSPFNHIQPSVEDAVGVQRMQTVQKISKRSDWPDVYISLFSQEVLNAVIMVDFCNPVYSWRRGCLMQYVPRTTTLENKIYDLSQKFIEAVEKSPYAHISDSPEAEFLALVKLDVKAHQKFILDYLSAVQNRMKENPVAALTDHLTLAESRRRVYRPLPLDEFATSMPVSLKLINKPLLKEMRPDGTIQDVPERGRLFLHAWISSLTFWDPQILPKPDAASPMAPVAVQSLPPPATLGMPCQRMKISASSQQTSLRKAKTCPMRDTNDHDTFNKHAKDSDGVRSFSRLFSRVPKTPNWDDDIKPMIEAPYWVLNGPKDKGQQWIDAMLYWGVGKWSLNSYDDVKKRALGIYQHVRSKTMPITSDPQDFWPDEAVETFRQWANAGFPKDASDSPKAEPIIPQPTAVRDQFHIRRDILSLSRVELAEYQAKLDDVLQVGALDSPWQKLGVLHAYWCLHYQEATFLWHRAYLLYVEKLIGMPIPYWNGYAAETADPSSEYAGIPPMFLEETYIHPSGEVRPNPLRYALAVGGQSKSGKGPWVTRSDTLVNGPSDPDWDRKIGLFNTYHAQLQHCLEQSTYTSPGTTEKHGRPWANIPTFSDDQCDELYQYRFDFDGLFEQVHDNYHGWVGPDMADNTYTANDPIFLSYHANMDRLAGLFINAHPEAQYTSSYPLQPFIDGGINISYDDPRLWKYTTIGDMAKDTRCLGYIYGMPVCADLPTPKSAAQRGILRPKPGGGAAITLPAAIIEKDPTTKVAQSDRPRNDNEVLKKNELNENITKSDGSMCKSREGKVPYVVFANVGCTTTSYRIDVFTADAKDLTASLSNNDYIGEVTRIGMGKGVPGMGDPSQHGKRACRQPNATRVLSAKNVWAKRTPEQGEMKDVQIVVTDLNTWKKVEGVDIDKLPGFVPQVVWLPESS